MSDSAAPTPGLGEKLTAEIIGTFILVFGVIGTALYSAGFAGGDGGFNVGFLGVALALGLSVVIGAYAFGPISGGHFNPAVTIGLAVAGRFAWRDTISYILAQLVGGVLASTLLLVILAASDKLTATSFTGASTGYDVLSPDGFGLVSVFIVEALTTAVFLFVILGVTSVRAAAGFAPLAIGFTLTVLALIAIPVSNASFNPARSIATAIYGGPDAIGQVWLSIVAPIVGAIIAAAISRFVFDRPGRITKIAH
ncbi:aquaporin [Agromyces atrinae]|uniref:Aquaporin Z n=1 Tax=Agromyces atrinae TaxID=592376 RepID=A0A4Q2M5C0_9MICO|nr:aquaporin [Agromyces atrinae]NYD66649.1 aquaporin Z [Agromyces atrinae]RXZ87315.1 aquaporin Z [Agromyces atrinae]